MDHFLDPYNTAHCDSGHNVHKVDDELHAKPHLETLDTKPVVINRSFIDANVDKYFEFIASKRAASEVDGDKAKSPKPKKAARKTKDHNVVSTSNDVVSNGKRRVGCPYFKKDPKSHAQKMSCRGIGFAEMAKLKDHLKDVHQLPVDVCKRDINFKLKPYTSLRTIDLKWRLVFQKLFPEVKVEDIPSPYSDEDFVTPNQTTIQTRKEDLDGLKCILKNWIVEYFGRGLSMRDFETKFDDIFEEAVDEWRSGPKLDNIKSTASHIVNSMKALEQSVSSLSRGYGFAHLTSPVSDAAPSFCESQDDTKVFNGLPMSPESISVEPQRHLTETVGPHNHDADANAFAENGCVPWSEIDTNYITGSALESHLPRFNLPGTWVFVPYSNSLPLDTPIYGQDHSHTQGSVCNPEVAFERIDRRWSIQAPFESPNREQKLVEYSSAFSRPVEQPSTSIGLVTTHQDPVFYDRLDREDAPSLIAPYLDDNFDINDWVDQGALQSEDPAYYDGAMWGKIDSIIL